MFRLCKKIVVFVVCVLCFAVLYGCGCGGPAMKMEEVRVGNSIVIRFTYRYVDEMSEQQKQSIQITSENYKGQAREHLKDAQAEDPTIESIIYEYYESDGDLVASWECK